MQDEKQPKVLSVIITLSVIIGALASAVAILYYFREKIGLERLLEKVRRDNSKKVEGCCCICDESEETCLEDEVPAEA